MGAIKAIVFDWDGTLVETMGLKIANAGSLFADFFKVAPEGVVSTYKRHSGNPRKDLFQAIAEENVGRRLSDQEFTRLSNEFTARNLASYRAHEVFDEHSREFLESLRVRGISLFVSSSAMSDEITTLAEHLEIRKLFVEMLGSRDGFRKGKDHIEYIRANHGFQTHELMFVGDEKADIRLSGKLGVLAVGIARDKSAASLDVEFADYVIQDLRELDGILTHV